MHERNKLAHLDFVSLARSHPSLEPHLVYNKKRTRAFLNYDAPDSLRRLAEVLLLHFFEIQWSLPEGFLIPFLPGRLDYVLTAADLLLPPKSSRPHQNDSSLLTSYRNVVVVDIGAGANCIFPLLFHKEFGWRVIGTDIDTKAIDHASALVAQNGLDGAITLHVQDNPDNFFVGVNALETCQPTLSVCNPPFYEDEDEEVRSRHPKRRRVGSSKELLCERGALNFIVSMIRETRDIHRRMSDPGALTPLAHPVPECLYYTCLVPRKSTLRVVEAYLRTGFKAPFWDSKVLVQGTQARWMVAWSWLEQAERAARLDCLQR